MDNFKVIYSIPFLFFIIVSCSNSSTEMVLKVSMMLRLPSIRS